MEDDPAPPARGRSRARPVTSPGDPSVGAQRVLDAALELFRRHGYEGTSLQQIADRMGVTKAAVYYHYRAKNEILAALVRPAVTDMEHVLETAGHGPGRAGDRREPALRALVDCLLRHARLVSFISRDVAAIGQPEVWRPVQAQRARVQALIIGQAAEADDRLAALWGIATVNALSSAVLVGLDEPEEWLREELVELGRHLGAGYRKARRRHGTAAAVADELRAPSATAGREQPSS